MIAVILSGGQSRRMGADKGLLQQAGTSWIEKLQHNLSYLNIPIYVSVNAAQQDTYQHHVSPDRLIVDDAIEGVNGPLKGILSVHHAHPEEHVLFVPCDMPLLDAPVFSLWLDTFDKHYPKRKLLVCKTPDNLQPLCGIFSRESLQQLNDLYLQKKLQDKSMHAVVEKLLHAYTLPVPAHLLPRFKNFNTPHDLDT